MAEDGVLIMGGAELERAAPTLSFADRGLGERNLTFLRLDSGFNEESLDWFDIVDEMEVEMEDEACCLRCGVGSNSKQKSCVTSPTHKETTSSPTRLDQKLRNPRND